jgi:hypothetical protein
MTAERRNPDISNDTLFNSSQQKPAIARSEPAIAHFEIVPANSWYQSPRYPTRSNTTAEPPASARVREKPPASHICVAAAPGQRRNSHTITTPAAAAINPDARKICGDTSMARAATRFIASGNNA